MPPPLPPQGGEEDGGRIRQHQNLNSGKGEGEGRRSLNKEEKVSPHFPFAYKYTKGRCGDGGGWIFKLGEKGKEEEEEGGVGKISYYAVAMQGHREKIFDKNNL